MPAPRGKCAFCFNSGHDIEHCPDLIVPQQRAVENYLAKTSSEASRSQTASNGSTGSQATASVKQSLPGKSVTRSLPTTREDATIGNDPLERRNLCYWC